MSNGTIMIILLIVEMIKKVLLYKMSYFPEPYNHSTHKIKVKLDLFNEVTKCDLKSALGVNTSKFANKTNLAS